MNTIRQFPIPDPIPGIVLIDMPVGATVLSARATVMGLSTISVWAYCDDALPRVQRIIEVVNSDQLVSAEPYDFVGTVIDPGGNQYHVFDRGETCIAKAGEP
jgi:hypothetical protein